MRRIAEAIVKIAEELSGNPLNGMSNIAARREVNKLLRRYTSGLFRDEDWRHVRAIWNAMSAAGLDWNVTDNKYYHNQQGVPSGKMWTFEVRFTNSNGRPTVLHGTLTASGAGSVGNPLEVYDIVAYV